VLSQISREIFGENIIYYYIQLATLLILSLAANTAFADFPRLASLISQDRYLPRQLTNWGDRLVYSNGILVLMALSGILIVLFGAQEHNLLPLYAVGVFISFTLSQSGMVIHWLKERHEEGFTPSAGWYFKMGANGLGAVCTTVVGLILMVTKFREGAWIVMLSIPLLVAMFITIHNHYKSMAKSLRLDGISPHAVSLSNEKRHHIPMIVLMNTLNRSSLQALEYALLMSDNVRVCAISTEPAVVDRLRQRWEEWGFNSVPLDVVDSPYREIGRPLLSYLHNFDAGDVPAMVVLPEFVVSKWWHSFLHNGTTSTIRDVLYHDHLDGGHGRPIIIVPYRLGNELYEPQEVVAKLKNTKPPTTQTDEI